MRFHVGSIVLVSCLAAGPARAGGTILSSSGEVQSLSSAAMMGPLLGTATFDEGPAGAPIPLDAYAAQGMQLHTGPLIDILPGVIVPGSASAPIYADVAGPFSDPVWGGVASGVYARGGVVATFTEPVTQIGVIAGNESQQLLTVWDTDGEVIAEYLWVPSGDAQFLGIDTIGRPIGMIAFGDDELSGSEPDPYTPLASKVASDTWVWSLGRPCETSADCDDGSVCTGDEVCQAGFCLFDVPLVCDDADPCTTDICDPQLGCGGEPINNCCHDDSDCPQLGTFCEDAVCVLAPTDTTTGSTGDDTTTDNPTGPASTDESGADPSTSDPAPTTTTTTTTSVTTTDDPNEPTPTTGTTSTAGEVGSGGLPEQSGAEDGCACDSRPRGSDGLLLGLVLLLLRGRPRRSIGR